MHGRVLTSLCWGCRCGAWRSCIGDGVSQTTAGICGCMACCWFMSWCWWAAMHLCSGGSAVHGSGTTFFFHPMHRRMGLYGGGYRGMSACWCWLHMCSSFPGGCTDAGPGESALCSRGCVYRVIFLLTGAFLARFFSLKVAELTGTNLFWNHERTAPASV